MRIYIATSWKNVAQPTAVRVLRGLGHHVYDFRNPPSGTSFGWKQLGMGDEKEWGQLKYLEALATARAREGFSSDMEALKACDVCVLLQPCGNDAHLELGWAVGAGKLTAIVLTNPTPQVGLMSKMADRIFCSMNDLIDWLADLEGGGDAQT